MVITKTTVEQLVDFYYDDEPWHKFKMPYGEALQYHQERWDKGNIVPYVEEDEVLGYYERYIVGDVCFLHNVFIKKDYRQGRVWRWLHRNFFKTMPINIKEIVGESQKLNGKFISRIITKERRNGNNQDTI